MLFKTQNLLKVSRRTVKILLRYTAEIVIIFIGITISFAFEQWREDQRQHDALIGITESLLGDTKAARKELQQDQPVSAIWIARIDSVRTLAPQKKLSPDQLQWFYRVITGQYTFLFEAYSSTFKSVSATTQWTELPDTIRTKIYRVFNNKLLYGSLLYNQQQENITHFRLSMLEKGALPLPLTDPVKLSPDTQVLEDLLTQDHWQNMITQVLITEKMCYQQNEVTIQFMGELENDLEQYLKILRN
jgi:hypothetical protein